MVVKVLMAESNILDGLGEESDIFKCKHCDNSFMKAKSLKKHMKKSHFRIESIEEETTEEEKSKEKFECNYCDNTFKKQRNLSMHIREDHDDEDLDDESVKFDIKLAKVQKASNECPECGIDYHIESELKRHMALRHSINNEIDVSNEETSLEEELLTQDNDEPTMSLDEVLDASGKAEAANEQEISEVELDGQSVSIEDINFDFNASSENNSSFAEEHAEEPEDAQDESENGSLFNFEDNSTEDIEEHPESVEVELSSDNVIADNNMEFEVDGESIVMDDADFDMLENAMQMTMSTPDDSDGEEDIPLSTRKRKNTSKLQKKRGRPSKGSKDDVEILLDGEAVVEDLDEADDIVVVDEVNIVKQEESGDEESGSEESEDDDPDFTPSGKLRKKKELPKRNLRSKRAKIQKTVAKSSKEIEPIQITPIIDEKVIGRRRTKVSLVTASSGPIINTIPKSTTIVFSPGIQKTRTIDVKTKKQSINVKPQNQSSSKKMLCSLCKRVFLTRVEFSNHMAKDHKKGKSKTAELAECTKCDKTFSKKTTLNDHMKTDHCHKCAKCRQSFDTKDSLSKHMRSHFIKCDKCNFAGESKQKVLEHKKTEHNFKCSKCRQAFDFKDKLENHVRANHFFKCGKCNVVFDAKSLQEAHNKKFHYFPCTSCDKVFDMKQRLMTHDKTFHHSCDVCEDEFSWPEPGHSCYYTKNNIRPVLK